MSCLSGTFVFPVALIRNDQRMLSEINIVHEVQINIKCIMLLALQFASEMGSVSGDADRASGASLIFSRTKALANKWPRCGSTRTFRQTEDVYHSIDIALTQSIGALKILTSSPTFLTVRKSPTAWRRSEQMIKG